MKPIRIASFLFAFTCTLLLASCGHNASKTSQSNPAAASAAQPGNAQAQPANAAAAQQPAQGNDTSQPSAAASGPAESTPSAGATQTAPAPAPAAQAPVPDRAGQPPGPAANRNTETTADTSDNDGLNQAQAVTIPRGTRVEIRLTQGLSSARRGSGQVFGASLDEPIVVGNSVVVPRGANVTGRVIYAKPSGRLRGPAELTLTLVSLEVGGRSYRIVTGERMWRGKSHKKRNLAWIGGGGGAGTLVGVAAGGGLGAAIGAGVGAGGGTVAAFVTGRKNIVLPSETRITFVLHRPVAVGS